MKHHFDVNVWYEMLSNTEAGQRYIRNYMVQNIDAYLKKMLKCKSKIQGKRIARIYLKRLYEKKEKAVRAILSGDMFARELVDVLNGDYKK